MRVRFALLSLFALTALSACWSAADPSTGSAVTITNASTIALTDVHVATGPDDELSDATIAAGATTALRAVREVHTDVHVTARVGSQSVSVIPIEGFVDGFNARLPDGTYLVVLTVHTETDGTHWLEANVSSKQP